MIALFQGMDALKEILLFSETINDIDPEVMQQADKINLDPADQNYKATPRMDLGEEYVPSSDGQDTDPDQKTQTRRDNEVAD